MHGAASLSCPCQEQESPTCAPDRPSKSCSCRWGPCPPPHPSCLEPRLGCLFSFFLSFGALLAKGKARGENSAAGEPQSRAANPRRKTTLLFMASSLRTRTPPGLGLSCPQPVPEHPARWVRFLHLLAHVCSPALGVEPVTGWPRPCSPAPCGRCALHKRRALWGEAGAPEAPCAAQQCGNGAPALITRSIRPPTSRLSTVK